MEAFSAFYMGIWTNNNNNKESKNSFGPTETIRFFIRPRRHSVSESKRAKKKCFPMKHSWNKMSNINVCDPELVAGWLLASGDIGRQSAVNIICFHCILRCSLGSPHVRCCRVCEWMQASTLTICIFCRFVFGGEYSQVCSISITNNHP